MLFHIFKQSKISVCNQATINVNKQDTVESINLIGGLYIGQNLSWVGKHDIKISEESTIKITDMPD